MSEEQASEATSESSATSEDLTHNDYASKNKTNTRSDHGKYANGNAMHTVTRKEPARSVEKFEEKGKRIFPTTLLDTVWKQLDAGTNWKRSHANLIISVIGDTRIKKDKETRKSWKKKENFKKLFHKGMTEIAESKGTWMFSFSSKEETVELLEVVIGSVNANENTVVLGKASNYFLSVDDGTEPKSGIEDTCPDLSNKKDVVFVFGGGEEVLKKVHDAVDNGIPVVVVKGYGPAADWIAAGYSQENMTKEETDMCKNDFDLKEILAKQNLVNICHQLDTDDVKDVILKALMKANQNNLDIQLSLAWRWNKVDFARNCILNKEVKLDVKEDILFATLVNDKADFVQLLLEGKQVMENEADTDKGEEGGKDKEVDTEGEVTIEGELDMNMFIYKYRLQKLYLSVLDHNSENDTMTQFIQHQLFWKEFKKRETLCDDSRNGEFSDKAAGQKDDNNCKCDFVANTSFQNSRQKIGSLMLKIGQLFADALNHNECNPYPDADALNHNECNPYPAKRKQDTNKQTGEKNDPDPFLDLFLFSILFNRQKMGQIMWRNCRDKLGVALVASAVLRSFAKNAKLSLELELVADLLKHAGDYEQKAFDVLTECYNQDKRRAHDLLIRKLEKPFDSTTPFAFADSNYLKQFMGHQCCQTKLNIIWRGNISVHTPWWKIVMVLFLPVLISTLTFTTSDRAFTVKTLCGTLTKCNKVEPDPKEVGDGDSIEKKDSSKKQAYGVRSHRNDSYGIIKITDAMYYLYTAPFSVFTFNLLSYVIFMVYFSYFIIVDLNEETSIKEYTIWVWSFTMFLEEFRQLLMPKNPRFCSKLRVWVRSHWNKFDLLINSLFITTVALRYILAGKNFQYVRFLYSVTVAMYFMRFLQAFLVDKRIGPKVIIIRKMMVDLLLFLGIFLVFFVSFSVLYQANLYPNSPPTASLLKKLVYKPYWQIFGELFLDEISGDPYGDCIKNESVWRSAGGEDRCPEDTRLVIFVGAVYFILTHIVLVNLLIAMFSYTFQIVQENSEHIWKFYWYGIVHEYYERPVLCPPLIILVHIYRTLRKGVKKCYAGESDNEFKLNDKSGRYSKQLATFVQSATVRYLERKMEV